ncbi:MAG TPA: FAD-binding protein [Candidatus Limnocylindria bacterium]|jgi:glycolate oxidase FAD binding subunit|nr:FAD-binding protein [Candidatus Limnocylindria bacterium]
MSDRLRPGDAAECARLVAGAAAASRTLRVRGGGTKDHIGEAAPTDAVLDTTALSGIVAHVPADLTVTVAAGTRFAELRSVLARAGQFLPLDPERADGATLGGIIGANSNGFWRARYGGVRDLLIGTTAVLADGTTAHSGGRVVKNVAGYDLNKLFVGSLGTLGVIVECTLKVLPIPPVTAGAHARFARGADAFAAADAVVRTSARPAALAVQAGTDREWELLLQADGDAAPVERTIALLDQAARARGARVERRDDVVLALATLNDLAASADGVVVRAALPLAAQPAYAATAAKLEGFARLVADAASGIVRVHLRGDDRVLVDGADALLAAARACEGSARVERRPDSLRARVRAWGDAEPSGRFLMRRLKESFDPRGILEPGRSAA